MIINDALAHEIIHASVSGGPTALGRFHSPSHSSALRALVATQQKRLRPGLGVARRVTASIRSAFAAPTQPACCPAI